MDINKNISEVRKYSDAELEDIFLSNALDKYKFFRREAERLKEAGRDPSRCEEYAEAQKLLLNRFTYVPGPPIEVEEVE